MKDDPKVSALIEGLDKTADKIRVLARAGFKRTEISALLGIRYQHVRNVLVRSGLSSGLSPEIAAEREPLEVALEPAKLKTISIAALEAAGFQKSGDWVLDSTGNIVLTARPPKEPGVYSFVLDQMIAYVGLSNSGLRRRLDQYRRGHVGQRTSSRIKQQIKASLTEGHKIQVWVAMPPMQLWNGLPVNTAAGLEAGLIAAIRPGWNILGAS